MHGQEQQHDFISLSIENYVPYYFLMLGFTVSFQEGLAKNQFLRKPAVIRTRRYDSEIPDE